MNLIDGPTHLIPKPHSNTRLFQFITLDHKPEFLFGFVAKYELQFR